MPSLRELQTDFAAAMFAPDGRSARLHAHCAGDTARIAQGIEAYRRSILSNLAAAVQATYPVVEAIVGTPFLATAARHYARERASRCGDLNAYGGDFDDFLAGYAPATALPYLPAVAQLEWLVQQVYGAADSMQDLSRLAAAAAEDWGGLRFRLDPAHALLVSRWPLARIWEVNQPGYDGNFTVDFEQAQTVLIHRRAQGIAVETLSHAEHALVTTLAAGNTLDSAVDAATAVADCDLQAILQRFLAGGLLHQAY